MRVLHVHNFYRLPGGEDQSFAATAAMLEEFGHEVVRYTLCNDAISGLSRVRAGQLALWNGEAYRDLRDLVRATRPDVAHFENTFPLISPAAYYACDAEGVAVVQTLHNFRIVCPSAIFYRNGSVCEDCLGKKVPWPGLLHRCYRGSWLASAVVVAMLASHRALGTWRHKVDAYIALNGFVRAKVIAAGLDPEKVYVNPNFLPLNSEPGDGEGSFALFAGRLTPEKGIQTLLDAWQELGSDLPLMIAGDGPLAAQVAAAAERRANIEWLGWRPVEEVHALAGRAKFVVVPSVWYEGFNRILLEAFAKGTPVIGSRLGSMQCIVEHGRTGLLFTPNDPSDLVRQVRGLLAAPEAYRRMRLAARREFETHYTAEVNHARLLRIYDAAREHRRRRTGG
jgi:glycosyltransferase involved in cell wall biosynthesis